MESLQKGLEGFLGQIGSLLPGVLGALLVLFIGWLVASAVRKLVYRLLQKTSLDDKIFGKTQAGFSSETLISKLVYYILMVIVLLVVLEMMGVSQVLDPLKNMVNEFMGFIPNLVAAGVIGFAGYIIATIASELVNMAGNFIEKMSAKLGLSADVNLSDILKKVVFIIVFIPILIVALDTLNLTAISEPAKEMLSSFINAIPNIFAAILIIGFFFVLGKFITGLLSDLLKSVGTDSLAEKLRLGAVIGEGQSLSKLLGSAAFFFIMFGGIITGLERLGFDRLTASLNNIFEMAGQIFFGLVILALGNFIATTAHNAMAKTENGAFLASVVRFAILGLFLAISLRTMGIANEIVNLAFGLTLGAVAVAVALSFGLGGREAAGKQMEHIFRKFRKED